MINCMLLGCAVQSVFVFIAGQSTSRKSIMSDRHNIGRATSQIHKIKGAGAGIIDAMGGGAGPKSRLLQLVA